jgi:hypothetical protein
LKLHARHFRRKTLAKLSVALQSTINKIRIAKLRTTSNSNVTTKAYQHIVMASRPTVTILSADGTASGSTHPLPKVFQSPIRPDIIQYAL